MRAFLFTLDIARPVLHPKSVSSGTDKIRLGWKEVISLPEWNIHGIIAKMDTGARRSALDVHKVVEIPRHRVQFDLILSRRRKSINPVRVVAPISHQTHVRSSNGHQHERYFVETVLEIGGIRRKVDFSLVNRASMQCRVLIGRTALAGQFLVDPGYTFCLGKP